MQVVLYSTTITLHLLSPYYKSTDVLVNVGLCTRANQSGRHCRTSSGLDWLISQGSSNVNLRIGATLDTHAQKFCCDEVYC